MKLSEKQIAQARHRNKTSVTASMIETAEASEPDAEASEPDDVAAHELELYMENTAELYPQKLQILMNLKKKMDSGNYDPALAPKLWLYWVNEGAKRYAKEFSNPGDERHIFTMPTKKKLAQELAVRYEQEIKAGEHNQAESAWDQLCASLDGEKPSLWGNTMKTKTQAAVDMDAIVQAADHDLKEFVADLIDYDRNVEAAELIERCDDSDVLSEIADSSVNVYNKDLLGWVGQDLSHAEYVDRAIEEGMVDMKEFSFWKLLMAGQYLYMSEKFGEAAAWLKEYLESSGKPAEAPEEPTEPAAE